MFENNDEHKNICGPASSICYFQQWTAVDTQTASALFPISIRQPFHQKPTQNKDLYYKNLAGKATDCLWR